MKTREQQFIETLKAQAVPFRPLDSQTVFLTKWFGLSTLFFGLCLYLLPFKPHLDHSISQPTFGFNSLLWLVVGMTSAAAYYQSLFPQTKRNRAGSISWLIFTALVVLIVSALNMNQMSQDFLGQLELWKGGCALLILSFASVQSTVMLWWARQGAPRSSAMTGTWAALSSAALGCLLMQFICLHDSSMHLLIWHFIPVTLFALLTQWIAKKTLRW